MLYHGVNIVSEDADGNLARLMAHHGLIAEVDMDGDFVDHDGTMIEDVAAVEDRIDTLIDSFFVKVQSKRKSKTNVEQGTRRTGLAVYHMHIRAGKLGFTRDSEDTAFLERFNNPAHVSEAQGTGPTKHTRLRKLIGEGPVKVTIVLPKAKK